MPEEGLYIQFFSIHGLIRGHSQEMGRDSDTGGQVKYVLELARSLAEHEDVGQVDLVTRLIKDKEVSEDYSKEIETLSDKARIVRIRCGGRKYIRKELLWPHLEEFIDKTIKFLKKQGRTPDIFHGHYADGGYVAKELARAFAVPFVFTGHSMGRNKKEKLLADSLSLQRINKQYKIDKRISEEEKIIENAGLIITSTQQEIENQYGLYDNFEKGRYEVVPPGIDLDTFYPYYDSQFNSDLQLPEEVKQSRVALLKELQRFWGHPEKPFILALCRPDQRKNIAGLMVAYGRNPELQAIANLAVFAGIRQNIAEMEDNERDVLTDMLLQMDKFDLYGKLAIPKKHDFATEVPELYRICAESRGVFVNPALVEPFGLTLIEASACGLPIIATNDGGPVDIVRNCDNGILVNVQHPAAIADAIKSILVNDKKWDELSNNGITGVRNNYSWSAHCHKFIERLHEIFPELESKWAPERKRKKASDKHPPFGRRLTSSNYLMITDIDNTLVGDNDSMIQLFNLLDHYKESIAWGVATGRSLELTIDAMTEYDIPMPDILICSVGTEIYYGPDLRMDKGWQQHISHKWKPEDIKATLQNLNFLVFQEAEGQRAHKISYYMEGKSGYLEEVQEHLNRENLKCHIIYSHGQFLDILPYRASKGKAIKYLKYKYEFPSSKVMVAGDSGNDEDMIRGSNYGLVVGNHSEELEHLKGQNRVLFSSKKFASGVIDGLTHYGFIQN
jgi:sucrose-phosphate synthase